MRNQETPGAASGREWTGRDGARAVPCMAKGGVEKKPPDRTPSLRIEPEKRLCPGFDPVTIALHRVAEPGEMGFRVLDNFCEEHIQ